MNDILFRLDKVKSWSRNFILALGIEILALVIIYIIFVSKLLTGGSNVTPGEPFPGDILIIWMMLPIIGIIIGIFVLIAWIILVCNLFGVASITNLPNYEKDIKNFKLYGILAIFAPFIMSFVVFQRSLELIERIEYAMDERKRSRHQELRENNNHQDHDDMYE